MPTYSMIMNQLPHLFARIIHHNLSYTDKVYVTMGLIDGLFH